MIRLDDNTANTVIVTVTEKATITNPVFLFEIINGTTKARNYFIAENISTQTQRYDKFIVTLTTDPDPLAGEVHLDKGEFTYNIYEQEDDENLDPTGLSVVETGIGVVVYSQVTEKKSYEAPIVKKQYRG